MNILIVSATEFEVQPLLNYSGIKAVQSGLNSGTTRLKGNTRVDVLVTGIGMVNTAYRIGRAINDNYDLVVNAGVCGAFKNTTLQPGGLVRVQTDILSEMGAEDGDNFLKYNEMGLPGTHIYKEKLQHVYPMLQQLPVVNGITVNTVHGNETSIKTVEERYRPDIESMEGAAFFAACEHVSASCVQVRAVSNYVERRDKSKWQMPLAITKLNEFLIQLVTEING